MITRAGDSSKLMFRSQLSVSKSVYQILMPKERQAHSLCSPNENQCLLNPEKLKQTSAKLTQPGNSDHASAIFWPLLEALQSPQEPGCHTSPSCSLVRDPGSAICPPEGTRKARVDNSPGWLGGLAGHQPAAGW